MIVDLNDAGHQALVKRRKKDNSDQEKVEVNYKSLV
jgi:hypothetical protein